MALTSPKMGLRIWDQEADPYDHNQLADNWAKVDQHDHSPGRGVPVPTEGITDQAITQAKLANGVTTTPADLSVTTAKLADSAVTTVKLADNSVTSVKIVDGAVAAVDLADAARLGLSDGTSVRRGQFSQAASGTRTNVAYGALDNGPDRVSNIVVPSNGRLRITYLALWQNSIAGAGRVAIFIGGNQLKVYGPSGQGAVTEAAMIPAFSTGSIDTPLATFAGGLITNANDGGSAAVEPTTGLALSAGILSGSSGGANHTQIEVNGSAKSIEPTFLGGGGACDVYIPAGTYDVEIMYKATSGSVSAKNRHLWVETFGY